jgi:hypothetical protein
MPFNETVTRWLRLLHSAPVDRVPPAPLPAALTPSIAQRLAVLHSDSAGQIIIREHKWLAVRPLRRMQGSNQKNVMSDGFDRSRHNRDASGVGAMKGLLIGTAAGTLFWALLALIFWAFV